MNIIRTFGTTTLDWLSRLPYFHGKGLIALQILRLCKRVLPLPVRLINDSRMWLGDDEPSQHLLTYWIGRYEHETVTAFLRCLRQLQANEIVVDVGANVGYYTILAAKQLADDDHGTVHAFEPNQQAVKFLQKNLELNRFKNVLVMTEGVGDITSTQTIHLSDDHITYGSLRPIPERDLNNATQIQVVTLDDHLARHPECRVGLIKIDIEGGELPALHGARQILERDKPFIIYEEFETTYQTFGYTTRDMRDYLQSLGYSLYLLQTSGRFAPAPPENSKAWCNMIAIPPGRTV